MLRTTPIPLPLLAAALVLGAVIAIAGTKAFLAILALPLFLVLLIRPQVCLWVLIAVIPVTIDFGGGLTVTRMVLPPVLAAIFFNAAAERCPWPNPFATDAGRTALFFMLAVVAGVALSNARVFDAESLTKEASGYLTRFVLFFVTLSMVKSARDIRHVLWVLVAVSIAEALITIAQVHFRFVLPGDWRAAAQSKIDVSTDGFRAEGTTPHPIFLAGFLQMVLPFLALMIWRARGLLRPVLAGCFVLLLYAWFSTYSRSSFIGMALMAVAAAWLWWKASRAPLVGGAIVFLAILAAHGWSFPELARSIEQIRGVGAAFKSGELYSSAGSFQFRLESWAGGLNLFLAHPLTGVGLGQARFNYMPYLPDWAFSEIHPEAIHNSFIEVAAEEGLLGLVPLLGLWFIALRSIRRSWNDPELSDYARALFIALIGQLAFLAFTPMVRDMWFTLALGAAMGHIIQARITPAPVRRASPVTSSAPPFPP
jgi:O-antigen ligase